MELGQEQKVVQQLVQCMGKPVRVNCDRYYTREHLWVKITPDGDLQIGITDYAQKFLKKKAVLVEFASNPLIGHDVEESDALGVVYGGMYADPQTLECECMAFDLTSPATGRIIDVNKNILENPELVSTECYDAGWIATIKPREDWKYSGNLIRPEKYIKLLKKIGKSPLHVFWSGYHF